MADKNELQQNEEELDIIAGARIPTKKELQAMREKFKILSKLWKIQIL